MLQIVASLIDAARGVIYDRHMSIVQAQDQLGRKEWGRPTSVDLFQRNSWIKRAQCSLFTQLGKPVDTCHCWWQLLLKIGFLIENSTLGENAKPTSIV